MPALSKLKCSVRAFINSTDYRSLGVFVCMDRSISITCQDKTQNKIQCAGPSDVVGAFEFVARILGLSFGLISDYTDLQVVLEVCLDR